MKYFLAFSVFILGLAIGTKTVANTEQSSTPPATATEKHDSEICKPEANTKCISVEKSKDWTHKRLEQVAAILPQPQKNPTQSARPAAVKLTSPQFLSNITGTTAKLEWTASSNAKAYHIQVSKDAGFNNRSMYVADEKWVKTTSYEVSGLEAGHKYFWRVAAVNNENDSMFTKSLFVSSAFETK